MIEFLAGGAVEEASGDLLAVPVGPDLAWGPGAGWVAGELGGWLEAHLEAEEFSGKEGEAALVPTGGRTGFAAVLFLGVGEEPDAEVVRRAAGQAGRRSRRSERVATTLHLPAGADGVRAVTEGFLLGQYRFDDYRSEPKRSATRALRFLESDEDALAEAEAGWAVAEGVRLARDLVNRPSAAKPATELARLAQEIGHDLGLRVRVLDERAIEEEGLGGLLAVSAGAERPPRLVEMWYEPEAPRAFLALVGKGIVFDSGGLSLKRPEAMEQMKTDMAGAAAVFGTIQTIAALGLPVKVLGITPLTENMPGGGAQRPGDVLRARNGKTIEVLNTDAEGRLVLADGLSLAAEAGPDLIVDLATLTGACKVALGEKIAGLWANDEQAAGRVEEAARRAGERVWRMPLPPDYRKDIDSEVADMKNTGGRAGGAINAALLLQEFVDGRPWVHLDIAGPARWPEEEHYQTKGGSGFGVRTLVALAEDLASG